MPQRENHVRFAAGIDYIDGEFRAFYQASLDGGYHRSGIRRFGELKDARAWLESEAYLYGAELACEEQL